MYITVLSVSYLRIAAAAGQTWSQVLEKSASFFNASIVSRKREVFGKSVFSRFETIRKQLTSSPSVRTGWLKLLREICEFPG